MTSLSPPRPFSKLSGPTLGILLKLASTVVFTGMVVCVKLASQRIPAGELVFARSLFGAVPLLLMVAWQGTLSTAFKTGRPGTHIARSAVGVTSMALWFVCLGMIPLPDAMAIGYAAPIFTVVMAALVLGETVRIYRWSAVAVGFVGILIILAPKLSLFEAGASFNTTAGSLAALGSAVTVSLAIVLIRKLAKTETTATMVLYFSVLASAFSLLSIPFGWVMPTVPEATLMIASGLFGGVGQLLMTESVRHADASTIATFDYAGMIWGLLAGALIFGETLGLSTALGTLLLLASGIFIIWRERRIGIRRRAEENDPTPDM